MASSIVANGMVPCRKDHLYYEQEGNPSGAAVLFIHGLGGTVNVYQPLVGFLQQCNLVRFDWAGHGRSTVPDTTSIESYMEDALAIIKHLSLENVTVVGHSVGGLVAIELAAKHPELVSQLVLFGPVKPPPDAGRNAARARAQAVREGGMAKVTDTVISNSFSAHHLAHRPEVVAFGRELLSRQPPEGYSMACLAFAQSSEPNWSAVKATTTIVSGAEDKVSSPPVCNAIKDLLAPSAKVHLISWNGVAHWQTLERPRESADIIKNAVGS